MSTKPRSPKKPGAPSAASRTIEIPGTAAVPPPVARPRAHQLTLAMALGQAEDQLVMPGCDDGLAAPHRVYRPAGAPPAARAAEEERP
jgi:hypothetical protein